MVFRKYFLLSNYDVCVYISGNHSLRTVIVNLHQERDDGAGSTAYPLHLMPSIWYVCVCIYVHRKMQIFKSSFNSTILTFFNFVCQIVEALHSHELILMQFKLAFRFFEDT